MALAGSPFSVVDQFVALREGLGTSPLAPQNQTRQIGTIQPNYTPSASQLVASPATPTAGLHVAGQFGLLEGEYPNLSETSHYRTPEHNAEVGGVPNSYHTQVDEDGYGRAKDYVGSLSDMQAAAARAKALGATEVLMHNVGSGYHLHVAF